MAKMKVNALSNIFNLYEKAAPKKKWPLLLTLITLLAAASGVKGASFNFPKDSVINEHNNFNDPKDEFNYPEKDPYEDSGYGLGGMKLKFELLDEMNNLFFMQNNKRINMIQFPANNPIQDRCFVYEIDMSNDVLEPIGSFQRIKDKEDKYFIKSFEKSAIKYVNEIEPPFNPHYYAHMSNMAIERGKVKSTKKGLDRGGPHGPSVLGPIPPWDSTVLTPTPVGGSPVGPPMGSRGPSMGPPMGSRGPSMGPLMGSWGPSMGPPMGSRGPSMGPPMGSRGPSMGPPMGPGVRMPMPANASATAGPSTQASTPFQMPLSFVETKGTEKTAEPTNDPMNVNAGESATGKAVESMNVNAGESATEEKVEPMDVDAGVNSTEETAEKVSDETASNETDEATESTSDEVVENAESAEAPVSENAEDAAVANVEEAAAQSAEAPVAENAEAAATEATPSTTEATPSTTEATPSTTEAVNAEAKTGEGSNKQNAAGQSGQTTEAQPPKDDEEVAIAGPSRMQPSDYLNRQEISNNVFERYSQYYDEMKAFNDKFLFAAVIDGHGGEVIADIVKRWLGFYVKKELMDKLRNNDYQILTPSDIVASLEEAHIQLDNDILKKAKEYFFKGNVKYTRNGSCSISVLVDKNYYYVSNVGDSKGLLIKKDSIVRLNNIQNAGELTERMRLVQEHPNEIDVVMCKNAVKTGNSKGVKIFNMTEENSQFQMYDAGRCYVKGRLQCTRSFGDFYLKHKIFAFDYRKNKFLVKEPHSFPYISAIPEVLKIRRTQDDEFIVLVSDGISDHLDDKEIYDIVKQYSYSVKKLSRILIQTVLIKAAMHVRVSAKELLTLVPPDKRRKFFDDMSVVVIKLN